VCWRKKACARPIKGIGGRVERIEVLAETQGMELIAPLLEGLGQRRPDAASLVAQKAQQADSCSTQRHRRIEVSCYIRGSKHTASPATTSTRGQTACPG
jgi:hypothetical protein